MHCSFAIYLYIFFECEKSHRHTGFSTLWADWGWAIRCPVQLTFNTVEVCAFLSMTPALFRAVWSDSHLEREWKCIVHGCFNVNHLIKYLIEPKTVTALGLMETTSFFYKIIIIHIQAKMQICIKSAKLKV